MHTNTTLDVARALTPGDGWWDRPKRTPIVKLAFLGLIRLMNTVFGR